MRPDINKMTLREKIGQTAIPAPPTLTNGMKKYGSYAKYFKDYPYSGIFIEYFYKEIDANSSSDSEKNNEAFTGESVELQRLSLTHDFAEFVPKFQKELDIPAFVCCDAEFGIKGEIFEDGHLIPTQIAVAAAADENLAYRRGYYWGREMRSIGMNWVFGPIGDLSASFFATHAPRSFSDDPQLTARMLTATLNGLHDAGMVDCTKHYPGTGHEFRDSHFSFCCINDTLEEWSDGQKQVWKAAVDAGAKTFMTAHLPLPCIDPTPVKGRFLRPGSASKKVLDVLRDDLGHDGGIISDAVSMKSLAATFEHEEVLIECFNAGNDMILFCHDDYFDIMERAIHDGRVSMERLDEAVNRILRLKEEMGLFDGNYISAPLTAEELADFEKINFESAAKSLTLVNNENNMIPFDPQKVHRAAIIAITEYAPFVGYLDEIVKTFEGYGIEATVYDGLTSKSHLTKLCDENDIIIYACYLNQGRPLGFPGFSSGKAMNTLFNACSCGNEKSVAVSFGSTSIYYNYFEYVDAYVDAYSDTPETMHAFVKALLGEIPFPGKPPMSHKPKLV